MVDEYVLKLETGLSPEVLKAELRKYEPWGHRIDFSNGVSTAHVSTAHHSPKIC